MNYTHEIASITVLVPYYRPNNLVTEEIVPFKVYKEELRYKVVPLLSNEERKFTGLPEEVLFSFVHRCIIPAKEVEEETVDVLKNIILELELQGLI